MKSSRLTQRISRLELIASEHRRESDGVRVWIPWQQRCRIIERIDDVLTKKAAGKILDKEADFPYCDFSEAMLREQRVRFVGDGPGTDWFTAPKGSLITLSPDERTKVLNAIAADLGISDL